MTTRELRNNSELNISRFYYRTKRHLSEIYTCMIWNCHYSSQIFTKGNLLNHIFINQTIHSANIFPSALLHVSNRFMSSATILDYYSWREMVEIKMHFKFSVPWNARLLFYFSWTNLTFCKHAQITAVSLLHIKWHRITIKNGL